MRAAALLAAALALCAAAAAAQPVVAFAAASLKGALDEIVAGWEGGAAVVSYAGSPRLRARSSRARRRTPSSRRTRHGWTIWRRAA